MWEVFGADLVLLVGGCALQFASLFTPWVRLDALVTYPTDLHDAAHTMVTEVHSGYLNLLGGGCIADADTKTHEGTKFVVSLTHWCRGTFSGLYKDTFVSTAHDERPTPKNLPDQAMQGGQAFTLVAILLSVSATLLVGVAWTNGPRAPSGVWKVGSLVLDDVLISTHLSTVLMLLSAAAGFGAVSLFSSSPYVAFLSQSLFVRFPSSPTGANVATPGALLLQAGSIALVFAAALNILLPTDIVAVITADTRRPQTAAQESTSAEPLLG